MRSWGFLCLILGVGAFILPMMNMQFVLLDVFGPENVPLVASILIAVGIVLVALSLRKPKEAPPAT